MNDEDFEKRRAGIMSRVERPNLPPRKCAITGRSRDEFFIDLGIDMEKLSMELKDRTQIGHLYLSAAACAEIAKISGFVPREEYLAQVANNTTLINDCKALLDESAAYKGLLNDVLAIRGDLSSDDIIERMRSLDATFSHESRREDALKTLREGTGENDKPSESSDEQGLADVRPDRSLGVAKLDI